MHTERQQYNWPIDSSKMIKWKKYVSMYFFFLSTNNRMFNLYLEKETRKKSSLLNTCKVFLRIRDELRLNCDGIIIFTA